jgi:hypothetical protein
MPRGKKNVEPVDDRTYDLATFGETEFNIPDQMVDKTKRGYKLVSPLTKSGKLSTRHGVPAIKLHPVHSNMASVLSSKVDRYKLSEFVKQSKLHLEEEHKKLTELQEKIVAAEVHETVLDLLQNVEIRNMVEANPATIEAVIEAVEEEVRNEVISTAPAVKKTRKKAEPKEKKMTNGEITETINGLNEQMKKIVDKEKPLMKKRLDELHKNGEIPYKRFAQLHDYFVGNDFKKDYRQFSPALTKTPTPENRYVFQKEGLISQTTANKYYALESQRDALYTEFNLSKEQNKSKKVKGGPKKKAETAFTGLSSTSLKEARDQVETLERQYKEMDNLKKLMNKLGVEGKASRPAPTYSDFADID